MMKPEPALPSTTDTDTAYTGTEAPPRYDPNAQAEYAEAKAPSPTQHANQCRDPFFAVAFIVHFVALLAIGWYCYSVTESSFANTSSGGGSSSTAQGGTTWGSWFLVALNIVIAIVFSYLILLLTKAQPKLMIWCSLIYGLVMTIFGLILAARNRNTVGIVFGVIAIVLNVLFIYTVRNRIDFTARLLTVAIAFTQAFPSSYLVILVGQALQTGFIWLYWFCAGSIVVALNDHTGANTYLIYFVYFLLAVSFYWTSEVIKNIVAVSVSGLFGVWYWLFPGNTPRLPALSALWRACTYSFGSIAFGSLIVAIVRAVRLMVNLLVQLMKQSGDNVVAVCAVACLEAIIGIIEGMVTYFNTYAYTYVGLYGYPYLESASRASDLFRTRGFDAILNDSLIGSLLVFLNVVISVTCLIVTALISYYGYANQSSSWGLIAGIGFLIGFTLSRTITAVIQMSVLTLFVCLAEDPATMARTKPVQYALIYEPIKSKFGIDLGAAQRTV